MQNTIIHQHEAPVGLKGSRVQELFKKRSQLQAQCYRGLLIHNRLVKIHGSMLKRATSLVASPLLDNSPRDGLPRRGTCVSPGTVEAFISYAHVKDLSWSILFVDVVKAFDKVVRQLSMGKYFAELMQLKFPEKLVHEIICRIGTTAPCSMRLVPSGLR